MAIYEYYCANCGKEFELMRPISRADEAGSWSNLWHRRAEADVSNGLQGGLLHKDSLQARVPAAPACQKVKCGAVPRAICSVLEE